INTVLNTITISQPVNLAAATPLTAGVSESQAVAFTATTGNFGLAFNGQVTTPLPAGATAAQVQSALQLFTGIGAGNVVVTGGAGNFTIKFQGALANVNVTPVTLVGAGNIVLSTTGTINLNNANNNWSGLVDINAFAPGSLTLNNIGSINLLGTPALA